MHNRRKTTYDPILPRILTVREDEAEVEYQTHKVKLEGLDLAAYRSRVESVLRGLLEQSEALRKIRAGQPVAPGDIESLVDDVLIHDPDLHLEELLVHYPNKSKSLEFAIRQVIGLDSARVDAHFRAFVQRYPALNANQIRFLDLLKSYLSRYGAIELDKLWEAPFTTIDSAGIDGVFQDSDQIDALLELLQDFNEPTA
jgi:type I restriction enzyme R subunit